MKKSELKQLIKEVITETISDDHNVLSDPSVKPLVRKLYDDTLAGRPSDEDDINAAVLAAFRAGVAKNGSPSSLGETSLKEAETISNWVVGCEGPKAWEQTVPAADIITAIKKAQQQQSRVQGPQGRGSPPTWAHLDIQ